MGEDMAEEYEKIKREFEMSMGKPFIVLTIELPEGFEQHRTEFLRLENDKQFQEEIKDLIKKRLILTNMRKNKT